MCACRCYYSSLTHELQKQHDIDDSIYSLPQLCHHYQLAYLDYVRFLVGAMWGAVTPNSCVALCEDINHGMHKRSAIHLVYMVEKADMVLRQLETNSTTGTVLGLHAT